MLFGGFDFFFIMSVRSIVAVRYSALNLKEFILKTL